MTDTCPVAFFVSDSTGITAETLGSTLITQFPDQPFERHTVPFVVTVERARQVAARIDAVAAAGRVPVVFSTVVDPDIRGVLAGSRGFFVDLFGTHIPQLETALHATASLQPGRAHGLGDAIHYQRRMSAVEYAMEHDDGQSVRALERADLILIAPSRCGKTPTSMYLALQHGIRAANFPLVDEDFEQHCLPAPVAPYAGKCFGLTSSPMRLSQVRQERRPATVYASLAQCSYELRNAEEMYVLNGIPHVSSASMSVEEISAMILQQMQFDDAAP
ncbi:pyruvate, phosphate dikinase/phosphoenolpyruvate synthase regulator [Kocuria sediminis]|uniref:Putative phosphoenolpyruvate synthase regulatory protein n=1 Tax=Kocuria sediminis TaxID=1038857 RepID=A0A6N8GMU7_9MICC|nr:pyruvate, water dikinase regulatory protein [Kocuria sediminis]MUN64208.1 pyruvate, phosphate dikinase/phosphoenolpyruvate synthase regulator [Kocuria sediminis]